jgi:branched-subunit amino acid aminotransferase/4-amino-4-deoxychorismate lyase
MIQTCLSTELSLHFGGAAARARWRLQDMTSLNGEPAGPDQLEALALVNYGHFTSLQVENGGVRGLSHHLDRLVRDCHAVFSADLDREQVRSYIRDEVDRSGKSSLGLRVTVFDPALDMGRPSRPATPSILVSVRPAAPASLPPLRIQAAPYLRELPSVKHIGLFGALTQRRDAQINGFDDALFIDHSGFISEGPTWNIGFHDGERVIWPSAETLPGVTMRLLKQVHDQTVTAPVHLRDVPQMRAAFATNVTIGVRPVALIDSVTLPVDADILKTLRAEYNEIPGEEI